MQPWWRFEPNTKIKKSCLFQIFLICLPGSLQCHSDMWQYYGLQGQTLLIFFHVFSFPHGVALQDHGLHMFKITSHRSLTSLTNEEFNVAFSL